MFARWLPKELAAWEAGFDEIDVLPDYVRTVDRDDWGCWMVLRAGGGQRRVQMDGCKSC